MKIMHKTMFYKSLTFEYKPLYLALMTGLFKGMSGFGFSIAKNRWLFSRCIWMVSGFNLFECDQIKKGHVGSSGIWIQLLSHDFGQISSDHFRSAKLNAHRWICYDRANGWDHFQSYGGKLGWDPGWLYVMAHLIYNKNFV